MKAESTSKKMLATRQTRHIFKRVRQKGDNIKPNHNQIGLEAAEAVWGTINVDRFFILTGLIPFYPICGLVPSFVNCLFRTSPTTVVLSLPCPPGKDAVDNTPPPNKKTRLKQNKNTESTTKVRLATYQRIQEIFHENKKSIKQRSSSSLSYEQHGQVYLLLIVGLV